ncbi:uncharacterized protein STEHIDRAFT_110518 [Stereum hirsutum FP-91666 SS1]|uniref:uncharacterized protein n=1 Tax=Stereum hirsutum (strain FP-91666) TaxID=721885 RepID=UPI000440F344|nr:uncharacterized protein STEHIDRAFT_110518 [Stereum hirsutum FP-91666 SS1]EIM87265.1 hypothetical protein STEHIDRAFT_110518 [Stereum hirsutum FP-91666 SS1]
MNTPNPYDTSSSFAGGYPHSTVSPYYNIPRNSNVRPESAECTTSDTVPSQHQFPSLSPQALRKPEEGHLDKFLSPSIPVDSQSTRRASTSAIYGQASTRTAPALGPHAHPRRPAFSLSNNSLGRQRSVSDTHIQPPRLVLGHQKSASTTTQPGPAFSDSLLGLAHRRQYSSPYFTLHPYDERGSLGQGQPTWSTQYATGSSVDTSAETSSRLASYDATPMSSASPFSAPVPQSFGGPSRERTTQTWSNSEQGDFHSEHVESLPAPDSLLFPATRLSTAPVTNYEQPSIPTTFPAPQSLTPAMLRPDHAIPRTLPAPNFPGGYTSGSEGYDGSSSTFSSVPFGATATKHSTILTKTSRPLDSNTADASTRPPSPPNLPAPTSSFRHMDPSSYATPDSHPSSSKQRAKKPRSTKTASHAQSLCMPGTSGAAVLDHDEPHTVGAVVKTPISNGKRKADEVEDLDEGRSAAGPSKKAKSDAKERKRETDREYQQGRRGKADMRREKMWKLAGIMTGTLEQKDESLLQYVQRCSGGQCHPERAAALDMASERIRELESESASSNHQAMTWRGQLQEATAKLQIKNTQIEQLNNIIRHLSRNGTI